MSPCRKCEARCCRYFALELDTPRNKDDFENIRWYLAHRGAEVFVERRKWFLEVKTRCRYLTKDHRCKIYEKRPQVCRDYDRKTCEFTPFDFEHDLVFKNLRDFDKYLDKRFRRRKKKKTSKRSSRNRK